MNFKEYDKFISNHKYDTLHFIIYYNLKCNNDFPKLEKDQIEELIFFIYDCYLKDEQNIDLSNMCDTALVHKNNILNGNFTKWNFLEVCYSGV